MRFVILILAAAVIGGCENRGSAATPPISSAGHLFCCAHVFKFKGHKQTFTVPSGVTTIEIEAMGAAGGGATGYGEKSVGGLGGRLSAKIPVTPGEKLAVFVGGAGGTNGGFNGGAPSGGVSGSGGDAGGGGGASDVREGGDRLRDRILVAGGGGGGGGPSVFYGTGDGGLGGGLVGGSGAGNCYPNGATGCGGTGGTQSAGGVGGPGGDRYGFGRGTTGRDGKIALGGAGGSAESSGGGGGGGGGAGGYYGGGGGGGGSNSTSGGGGGGGGGGGSSYAEPSARHVKDVQGVSSGNGQVIIFW